MACASAAPARMAACAASPAGSSAPGPMPASARSAATPAASPPGAFQPGVPVHQPEELERVPGHPHGLDVQAVERYVVEAGVRLPPLGEREEADGVLDGVEPLDLGRGRARRSAGGARPTAWAPRSRHVCPRVPRRSTRAGRGGTRRPRCRMCGARRRRSCSSRRPCRRPSSTGPRSAGTWSTTGPWRSSSRWLAPYRVSTLGETVVTLGSDSLRMRNQPPRGASSGRHVAASLEVLRELAHVQERGEGEQVALHGHRPQVAGLTRGHRRGVQIGAEVLDPRQVRALAHVVLLLVQGLIPNDIR